MAKCAKCLTPWIRSDDDLDIVYLCFQVRVILGTVTSLDAVVGPHDNFLSVDGIWVIERRARVIALETNMSVRMPFPYSNYKVKSLSFLVFAAYFHPSQFVYFWDELLAVFDSHWAIWGAEVILEADDHKRRRNVVVVVLILVIDLLTGLCNFLVLLLHRYQTNKLFSILLAFCDLHLIFIFDSLCHLNVNDWRRLFLHWLRPVLVPVAILYLVICIRGEPLRSIDSVFETPLTDSINHFTMRFDIVCLSINGTDVRRSSRFGTFFTFLSSCAVFGVLVLRRGLPLRLSFVCKPFIFLRYQWRFRLPMTI